MDDILKNCKQGRHELKKIYSKHHDCGSEVVRWCEDCGSIVVDSDFDGRTAAGAVMKMKSPKISLI